MSSYHLSSLLVSVRLNLMLIVALMSLTPNIYAFSDFWHFSFFFSSSLILSFFVQVYIYMCNKTHTLSILKVETKQKKREEKRMVLNQVKEIIWWMGVFPRWVPSFFWEDLGEKGSNLSKESYETQKFCWKARKMESLIETFFILSLNFLFYFSSNILPGFVWGEKKDRRRKEEGFEGGEWYMKFFPPRNKTNFCVLWGLYAVGMW